MRALREAWISLGIGNRNDSASGLEAGGGWEQEESVMGIEGDSGEKAEIGGHSGAV